MPLNEATPWTGEDQARVDAQKVEAPAPQPTAAPQEQVQTENTGEIDNPIGQLLEGGAVNVRDFIDNVFQGDQRTKEEIAADRNEARKGAQDRQDKYDEEVANDTSAQAEIRKAVAGAPVNLYNKAAGAVEFGGDVVGGVADELGLVDRDETDIPWAKQYEYARYDLGKYDTKTWYGDLVQESLSFVLGGMVTKPIAAAAGAQCDCVRNVE